MRPATIVTVFAISIALQGCVSQRTLLELTADCSSVFSYGTSDIRDITQEVIDYDKKLREFAACTDASLDGWEEVRAEAVRLNELATNDRNAGIPFYGQGVRCEKYEAYTKWVLWRLDWAEGFQDQMGELTDAQRECVDTVSED